MLDHIRNQLATKRPIRIGLVLVLVLLAGATSVKGSSDHNSPTGALPTRQKVLLVINTKDVEAEEIHQNTLQAFNYARFLYDEFDLAGAGSWPGLERYTTVLFATELLKDLSPQQIKQITQYVNTGGNLVVIYRGWNRALAPVFGAQPANLEQRLEFWPDSGGIHFYVDLMPGINGLALNRDVIPSHSAYNLKIKPEASVIATDDQRRPVAWLYNYGHGRTLYWNTTFLSVKEARGLIIQSILSVQPVSVLPVANLATFDIDGFPAPFSHQRLDPVAEEYNMATDDFYRQVWLSDMLDLANKYHIPLTFYARFGDNKKVHSPFDFAAWEANTAKVNEQTIPYGVYAAHLIAGSHRLGIEGYNALPLSANYWPSQDDMAAGLQAAANRWRADNLGPLPKAFSSGDMVDASAALTLRQTFPTVQVVGMLNTATNEFGPLKNIPDLFVWPRLTDGYTLLPNQQFAMLSELGNMGVWTHVIYPDGIFANPANYPDAGPYRNPDDTPWHGDSNGKTGLYYKFQAWLEFARTYYPWLRYVFTEDAYPYLRDYLSNAVIADISAQAVSVQADRPTYFQLRINGATHVNASQIQGADIVSIYQGSWYTLLTLKGTDATVNIPLGEPPSEVMNQTTPPSGFETPAPGEVTITEFMVNPAGQEWFEVYNRTERYINLAGLTISIGGKERSIDTSTRIPPKGYAVLAQTNGSENGFDPKQVLYTYGSSLMLDETQGTIQLKHGQQVITDLAYDVQQRWPIQPGIAVGLQPTELNTDNHSDGMKWCQSVKLLPNNPHMYGSPGQPNHLCSRTTPDVPSPALAVQTGELVITEVMMRTSNLSEGPEWFEVYNPTDHPVSMRGVTFTTRTQKGRTITEDVVINPGQYLVMAQADVLGKGLPKNINVYHYDFILKLNNSGDAIYLRRGVQLIDAVVFDNAHNYPLRSNVAMSLHPGAYSAYMNDDGLNWCFAETPVPDRPNMLGTPGMPNPPCPMWGVNSPLVDNPAVYTQDSLEPITIRIKMDPVQLEYMTLNPYTRQRFPATFEADGFKPSTPSDQPNATIRIRGASTRRALQKSFAIHLETTDDYRGQQTIQLNRHFYDESRMRNYTGYALLRSIDNTISLRTQFVRLYINDVDFGLFTQVEHLGARFLRDHGLNDRSSLFKLHCTPDITCFAYQMPSAEMRKQGIIEGVDIHAGNSYDGLYKMLDDLHTIDDINVVIDRHFNRDNLITFLATMYLYRQLDMVNQNYYLYATPREPDRFYFIAWDLDGALFTQRSKALQATRWWRGFGYLNQAYLWQRFLHDPKNARDVLTKIDELYKTILSRRNVTAVVDKAVPIVRPFIRRLPEISAYMTEDIWQSQLDDVEGASEGQYADLAATVHWPMPVFTNIEYQKDGTLLFSWDESYTLEGNPVTYELVFFSGNTWDDKQIIYRIPNITDPYIELQPSDFPSSMRNHTYYWMVYMHTAEGDFQTSYTTQDGHLLTNVKIP